MMWFILAIVFAIIAIMLHKSADKTEAKGGYSGSMPSVSVPKTPPKSFWEMYKGDNPSKASEIENLLKIDFSKLSDKDAKEKIASVNRFAKGLKCEISQIKVTYLAEVEKYPARLLPEMIASTLREQENEASTYHISKSNTMTALMTEWLRERHEQLGRPDAKVNAPSSDDEMEIVKALNPSVTEALDLNERLKTLRQMSILLKCPMRELRDYYINDVKKSYDGKYENFHYLPEAYKYMASKAFEVASSAGVKPVNTSYGIMCDWLADFMIEERERFIETCQAKCIMCGSRDIKLNFFKDHFVCKSCNHEFGGL
ncbi:MAG: hypothetical protein SPL96_06345 [Bacteroidales bacterium]|nr:hypothetical protein [Bacteroidales bacterium]